MQSFRKKIIYFTSWDTFSSVMILNFTYFVNKPPYRVFFITGHNKLTLDYENVTVIGYEVLAITHISMKLSNCSDYTKRYLLAAYDV